MASLVQYGVLQIATHFACGVAVKKEGAYICTNLGTREGVEKAMRQEALKTNSVFLDQILQNPHPIVLITEDKAKLYRVGKADSANVELVQPRQVFKEFEPAKMAAQNYARANNLKFEQLILPLDIG